MPRYLRSPTRVYYVRMASAVSHKICSACAQDDDDDNPNAGTHTHCASKSINITTSGNSTSIRSVRVVFGRMHMEHDRAHRAGIAAELRGLGMRNRCQIVVITRVHSGFWATCAYAAVRRQNSAQNWRTCTSVPGPVRMLTLAYDHSPRSPSEERSVHV